MDAKVADLLSAVTIETFEKLGFLFGEPARGGAEGGGGRPSVAVCARFRGPFSGALWLAADEGILAELAANMLGVDERQPVPEALRLDALCESVNVVCGRLLSLLAGEEAEFDIAPAVVVPGGSLPAELSCWPFAARSRAAFDGGRCEVLLAAEDGLPAELPPAAMALAERAARWGAL